ncbi:hypothetical protein PPYR_15240, partial [Photinus pyralis]
SESDNDPFSLSDSLEDPNFVISENESRSSSSSSEDSISEDVSSLELSTLNDEPMPVESNVENSDRNEEDDTYQVFDVEWKDPTGNHEEFGFTENSGINPELAAALVGASPEDYLSAFIDDEILNVMTEETNLYATQMLLQDRDVPKYSRLHAWQPTNKDEIKKFLGILGYMGIVKLPTLRHYWCKRRLFGVSVVAEVMSRNRFELLLTVWHFSDNQTCPEGDRGYKIEPLINSLVKKFQNVYTPGKEFCIDETLVPFRGRLIMKQYIPQKTHKYGIKLFKLCCENGYTWNIKLYCGKEKDAGASVPTNVVMKLSEKLLNTGRTIVTDNYYTSLELANKLLDNKTHLLGTLRANRRGNPKDVVTKKLKPGEIIAKENNRGICIMKWKDRRDVLMLSTKHTNTTTTIKRRTGIIEKPLAIVEYNKAKSSIDLSDQMASYSTALRKTVKWYRKIALELLLGTAVVNAHFLFKAINDSTMSITDFREIIIESLLFPKSDGEETIDQPTTAKKSKRMNVHTFQKKKGRAHEVRKYCKGCYEKKLTGLITKNKVPKVTTYCEDCDKQPHFCIDCFANNHK